MVKFEKYSDQVGTYSDHERRASMLWFEPGAMQWFMSRILRCSVITLREENRFSYLAFRACTKLS